MPKVVAGMIARNVEPIETASEIALYDLLHARSAQRKFPVSRHHVNAEQFARVDHVLAARPQRSR